MHSGLEGCSIAVAVACTGLVLAVGAPYTSACKCVHDPACVRTITDGNGATLGAAHVMHATIYVHHGPARMFDPATQPACKMRRLRP